jgi:anti-sigma regulatory factor (Ser/Thr protein kinase)
MQRSTSMAGRLIAVLSPDSVRSEHAEAEWRLFYAKDPTGERGLLVPVRGRAVDPSGLLGTRVYVDLVGRDAAGARAALLAAARGSRGRPAHEPEFPGSRGRSAFDSDEAPRFPGALRLVDKEGGSLLGESIHTLSAEDVGAILTVIDEISVSMRRSGFSDSDVADCQISLRELFDNVATHVRTTEPVNVKLSRVEPSSADYFVYDDQVAMNLEVMDSGNGFDFANALRASEYELSTHGVEHGLLRAYRLGSLLHQVSIQPHVMGWIKERSAQAVPSVFEGEHVIPLVFSYRQNPSEFGKRYTPSLNSHNISSDQKHSWI